MVQVDVFWSYALGASFAASASRQLKKEKQPFNSIYFTYTLLYLSCIFAPSGIYLLWNFPHWETMQVATSHMDIPAWLVVLFSITNITQGILGFWISYLFIKQGKYYAAHLQWFIGYFFMFFILLHGWDGLGWQRFLYDPTVNNSIPWEPGKFMTFSFIISNVALTLYSMGLFVIPFLIIPMAIWIKQGIKKDLGVINYNIKDLKDIIVHIGMGIFIVGFGSAFITTIIVAVLGKILDNIFVGFLLGLFIFAIIGHFFLFKKDKPFYLIIKPLFIKDEK